jgi:intracellular septation protein A
MKLKTIQTLCLIALFALIIFGTITKVFNSAETIAWSAVWLGCAVAHLFTNDSNI